MNPKTSRVASLLGSTSLLAMACAGESAAQAQTAAPAELPEQVLITGSLIRGTPAIGATVTNISPQDFAQTGSFTSTELLKTVPGITVVPAATPAAQGGGPAGGGGGQINIRGFDSTRPARELILVDGYRVAEELREIAEPNRIKGRQPVISGAR